MKRYETVKVDYLGMGGIGLPEIDESRTGL